MVLYWAIDALLVVWTVVFVTSDFFYERFTRQPSRSAAAAVVVAPEPAVDIDQPDRPEKVGELPSLLARALEQVEDQTYAVPNTHRAWPDALVSDHRN